MRLPRSAHRLLSAFQPISIAGLVGLCLLLPSGAYAGTPQLVGSPLRLDFGTVDVSQNQSEMVSLVNSGSTAITVSAISANNSAFAVSGLKLPVTLPAGAGTTFNVMFSPTDPGWVYGTISVTSTASNSTLQLPISGAGGILKRALASPATVSFGNVPVGTTATTQVVVTNQTTPMPMRGLLFFGNGFSATGPSMPMNLAPKQSVTINVSFTPTTAGTVAGAILIEGASLNIPVNGTGTTGTTTSGQLSVSPASVSFGSVQVGTSTTQSSSMKATGGNVTVNSAASTNSQFTVSGVQFPLALTAGQSVPYQVVYTPTKSGTASATLSFATTSSTTATESASGSGAMPFVTLSWSASTSSVQGYNIYRGTAPGSYTKLNPSVDASTTYTDNSVVPGTTYYYAATSVSSSGQESGFSSPLQVAVP
jgi:Abnormal spindle-like microcephaly-assoc'd, ASPM-SPD-2-Hydin